MDTTTNVSEKVYGIGNFNATPTNSITTHEAMVLFLLFIIIILLIKIYLRRD